jgi:acyl-CoA thioesterase
MAISITPCGFIVTSFDDWLLYACDVEHQRWSRPLAWHDLRSRGNLVASTAQEGVYDAG